MQSSITDKPSFADPVCVLFRWFQHKLQSLDGLRAELHGYQPADAVRLRVMLDNPPRRGLDSPEVLLIKAWNSMICTVVAVNV